jgi:signal transduction histidine kinase
MSEASHVPARELKLTERVLFERMGWFVEVRWVAGGLALVFMAMGWHVFHVRFAALPAVIVVGALFFYNAFFSMCARALYQSPKVSKKRIRALAHGQIACDLVAVAALVHTIGGVENHFIILFIFPMVVASEFFPPRIAYGYAALAAALVNLIGWGEYFFYSTAHYPLQVLASRNPAVFEMLVAPKAGQHWVFVLQVCFVITFAVFATVFVASSIAGRLRQREDELEAAYQDLQSLEKVKSTFMRKTSHELRAPVGALQSLLKAAMLQIPESAEGRDLVARAVHRTEHMLDLIDDLLKYSRLRATIAAVTFEPVELAEIVRAAADLLRPRAEEKKIRLEVQAGLVTMRGMRDGLADLVTNLVSNAIRYTPEGGTVSVRCGLSRGRVRFDVADTGIGIPPDELPHVFEEFFRGAEAKKVYAHGTGLGMAIVQRVVEMHDGTIDIQSEVGKGTRFSVTFPRPAAATGPVRRR